MIEEATQTPSTKCGYVALIGRPNAGKSTLLNRILGQQVAIVTSKPQTTRNRILAVHNDGDSQFIFLDTPGLHNPTGTLGEYMNEAAGGAIDEADICVWLLDVARNNRLDHLTRDEQDIAARLQASGRPVIVLPNKVDLVKSKSTLLGLLQSLGELNLAQEIIPISALSGDGVDVFLKALRPHLPETDWLYPADLISDQAERFFAAEIVREAVTDFTRQEIPYQSAVVVEKFVEETQRCVIHATIFVERASQKGIIIGKGGSMIKKIGERSRKAIAEFLGCAVEIKLHVNVSPGWSKDADGLKKMGYE